MRKFILFTACLLSWISSGAQSGGDNVFDFLSLPPSARVGALGGKQVSIFDDDVNFVHSNPSLLNGSMSNQIALNYINYLADINYYYLTYARTVGNIGNIGAGLQYFNYGEFIAANIHGDRTGTFNASDYTINLYYSRPILDSLLHVGGTLKLISSNYEAYNAFGVGLDAGVTYYNADRLFSAAFVVKNLGFQLNTYSSTSGQEPFPFEIQMGVTQKLRYAPFRFSVMLQHLETPDLSYTTEADRDDQQDVFGGQDQQQSKLAEFGDNFFRHVIFGLEFVPTKNFHIDFGYNYKRRQELKLVDQPGWSGISFGFGLKLYKFRISYSHASYHIAAITDQFSVNVNLSEFSSK